MKLYKKFRHFERPFVLHFFVGFTSDEIVTRLNRIKTKKAKIPKDYIANDGNTEAMVYPLDDQLPGHFVFAVYGHPKYSTIVHETLHCVAKHFQYIGQPLSEESEESYAYMQEWLFTTISKLLYPEDINKI